MMPWAPQPTAKDDLLIQSDSLLSLIRYREGNPLSPETIKELDDLLARLRPVTDDIVRRRRQP